MIQEDVLLTEELGTEWNGNGDAHLVTNEDALEQSILVSALQAIQNFNDSLTADGIEELRGNVENAVENNANSTDPVIVEVTNIDWDDSVVFFEVATARVSLEFGEQVTGA